MKRIFFLVLILLIAISCNSKKKQTKYTDGKEKADSTSIASSSEPIVIPSDSLLAYKQFLQQEQEYLIQEQKRLLEQEPVLVLGTTILEEITKNPSDSKAYDYYFRLFEEITDQHGELLLEYDIWLKQVLPDSTLKVREVNLQPYFRIQKLHQVYKNRFEDIRKQYLNWLQEMKRKYHPSV